MEFRAEARALRAAVDACKAAATSGTLSTTGSVLLSAEDGSVSVTGINALASTNVTLKATTKTAGACGLDCKALSAQLRHIPGEVHVVATSGTVTLKSAKPRRTYKLAHRPAEDFPKKHDPSGDKLVLSAEPLGNLIANTSFSICADDSRPNLNNALLETGDGWVAMVTTDGHRFTRLQLLADVEKGPSRHIPKHAVTELARLTKLGEDIELSFTNARLFATCGSHAVAHSVKAGFPPYQGIIPQRAAHPIRVNHADLRSALAASAAVRREGVALHLSANQMRLLAEDPSGGAQSEETIDCKFSGKDCSVGVNTQYLLDAISAAQSDTVEIDVVGELDPIGIYGAEGFLAIVMPTRI